MYTNFRTFILSKRTIDEIKDILNNSNYEIKPDWVNFAQFIGIDNEFVNDKITYINFKSERLNKNINPFDGLTEFKEFSNNRNIDVFNIFLKEEKNEFENSYFKIVNRENIIKSILDYLDVYDFVCVNYLKEDFFDM